MSLEQKVKKGIAGLALGLTLACGGKSPTSPSDPPPPPPPPMNVTVRANATETFSGSPINVDFVLDGCGNRYSGSTDGSSLTVLTCNDYTMKVGMNQDNQRSSEEYVPSVFDGVSIMSDNLFNVDLPSYKKLFPVVKACASDITCPPAPLDPRWAIEVYRGRGNKGRNQVWRSQPSKWIVHDPDGHLKQFDDPKYNPDFDNIMKGYAAVEDYTRGYIRPPSRDEIEIVYDRSRNYAAGEFFFRIYNGGFENEILSGNVIVGSFAATPTRWTTLDTLTSEMVSSVQGGDSESDGFSYNGFRNRPVFDIDRTWGEFNYHKREPGDVILPSGDAVPSPFGFPVEIRKLR